MMRPRLTLRLKEVPSESKLPSDVASSTATDVSNSERLGKNPSTSVVSHKRRHSFDVLREEEEEEDDTSDGSDNRKKKTKKRNSKKRARGQRAPGSTQLGKIASHIPDGPRMAPPGVNEKRSRKPTLRLTDMVNPRTLICEKEVAASQERGGEHGDGSPSTYNGLDGNGSSCSTISEGEDEEEEEEEYLELDKKSAKDDTTDMAALSKRFDTSMAKIHATRAASRSLSASRSRSKSKSPERRTSSAVHQERDPHPAATLKRNSQSMAAKVINCMDSDDDDDDGADDIGDTLIVNDNNTNNCKNTNESKAITIDASASDSKRGASEAKRTVSSGGTILSSKDIVNQWTVEDINDLTNENHDDNDGNGSGGGSGGDRDSGVSPRRLEETKTRLRVRLLPRHLVDLARKKTEAKKDKATIRVRAEGYAPVDLEIDLRHGPRLSAAVAEVLAAAFLQPPPVLCFAASASRRLALEHKSEHPHTEGEEDRSVGYESKTRSPLSAGKNTSSVVATSRDTLLTSPSQQQQPVHSGLLQLQERLQVREALSLISHSSLPTDDSIGMTASPSAEMCARYLKRDELKLFGEMMRRATLRPTRSPVTFTECLTLPSATASIPAATSAFPHAQPPVSGRVVQSLTGTIVQSRTGTIVQSRTKISAAFARRYKGQKMSAAQRATAYSIELLQLCNEPEAKEGEEEKEEEYGQQCDLGAFVNWVSRERDAIFELRRDNELATHPPPEDMPGWPLSEQEQKAIEQIMMEEAQADAAKKRGGSNGACCVLYGSAKLKHAPAYSCDSLDPSVVPSRHLTCEIEAVPNIPIGVFGATADDDKGWRDLLTKHGWTAGPVLRIHGVTDFVPKTGLPTVVASNREQAKKRNQRGDNKEHPPPSSSSSYPTDSSDGSDDEEEEEDEYTSTAHEEKKQHRRHGRVDRIWVVVDMALFPAGLDDTPATQPLREEEEEEEKEKGHGLSSVFASVAHNAANGKPLVTAALPNLLRSKILRYARAVTTLEYALAHFVDGLSFWETQAVINHAARVPDGRSVSARLLKGMPWHIHLTSFLLS